MVNVTRKRLSDVEIGERLEKCRKNKGLTQKQVCDMIYELPDNNGKERNEKQIGYIENGKRSLSKEYAILFSQVFGVRYEYLMGQDDYETEADKKLAETYEESDKIFQSVNRTDDIARRVTAILSAMDYHLHPTGYTDAQRENDKEMQDACTFFNILETDNKYINNRIPMALLQELREKINANSTTTCDDNPSLGDMILSGFSDIEEKTKQEIIDDPISYLISAKHYASQMEHHQMSVEYDLFDNNGNKLLHLGKYEKDDFINQLYDVVTALIQYHITKKKGQA